MIGFLDFFKVPTSDFTFEDSSGTFTSSPQPLHAEGGEGTGARVRVPLHQGLFLQGEFQTNDYNRVDDSMNLPVEVSQLRGGLGYKHARWPLYGMVEIVQQKAAYEIINYKLQDVGFGAHVGVEGGTRATFYAQLGYVDAGDFGDGLEYVVGGSFKLNPVFAVFVDRRETALEDDDGGSHEFSDTRIGLRINFVSGKKKKP